MPRKKKQFVSKDSAQHYKLVFKSQNPELNDVRDEDDEPQTSLDLNEHLQQSDKIFVPTNKYKKHNQHSNHQTPSLRSKRESFDEEFDEDEEEKEDDESMGSTESTSKSKNGVRDDDVLSDPRVKKRRRKYNYRLTDFEYGEYGFPDDGYDYSQHFSEMGRGTFISAVLSEAEIRKSKPNTKKSGITFKDLNVQTLQPNKPNEKNATSGQIETPAEKGANDEMEEEIKKLKKIDIEIYEELFPEKKRGHVENKKNQDSEPDLPETQIEGDLQDDFVLLADQIEEEEQEEEFEDPDIIVGRVRELHLNEPSVDADSLIDQQFELLQKEYEDEEIGDLEGDTRAKGNHDLDSQLLQQLMNDHMNKTAKKANNRLDHDDFEDDDDLPDLETFGEDGGETNQEVLSDDEALERELAKQKTLEILNKQDSESDVEYDDEEPVGEQWDCESVLSTLSNVSNHPSVIREEKLKKNSAQTIIELSKKTGIPLNTLPKQKQPKEKLKKGNLGESRPFDETPEEKAARKKQIKDQKQANRQRKKNLKLAFKEEKKQINPQVQQRVLPMSVL